MEGLKEHSVELEGCGPVHVFIQGETDRLRDGVVFLSVHDVGASYQTWLDFSNHESMAEIQARAVFLHVALPGQEPGAADLAVAFPSMAVLGMGLVTVLDHFRVPMVVGLGAGAGANILTRFAMNHPGRVHGVLAVNISSQKASSTVLGKIKETLQGQDSAKRLNEKNVAKFTEAYKKRDEILTDLKRIKCDMLLLAGAKSKNLADSEALHKEIAAGICSIIKMDKVAEPLLESTDKAAEALLLFCQGMGLLPTLGRRASRQDSLTEEGGRRISMGEYDTPNIRRLSLSAEAMGDVKGKPDDDEDIQPTTMADYDRPNIRRLSLVSQ